MQRNAIRSDTLRYDTTRYDRTRYDTIRYGTDSTVQYQYSTVQYSTHRGRIEGALRAHRGRVGRHTSRVQEMTG